MRRLGCSGVLCGRRAVPLVKSLVHLSTVVLFLPTKSDISNRRASPLRTFFGVVVLAVFIPAKPLLDEVSADVFRVCVLLKYGRRGRPPR